MKIKSVTGGFWYKKLKFLKVDCFKLTKYKKIILIFKQIKKR